QHATSGGRRCAIVVCWFVDTCCGRDAGDCGAVSHFFASNRSVEAYPARGFGRCIGDARAWRLVAGCPSVWTEAHSYTTAVNLLSTISSWHPRLRLGQNRRGAALERCRSSAAPYR